MFFVRFFFLCACKLCKVNVNIHMLHVSLQLLVSQEDNQFGSYANQS